MAEERVVDGRRARSLRTADDIEQVVVGGTEGLERTKLQPPALPRVNVPRTPLIRLLDAAVHKRITLVVAPTGYGKSVFVGQWAASHARRRIAWLTVDAGDNDPIRFGRYLRAALAAVDPSLDRPAQSAGRATPPIVLVLDDVQAISNANLFDGLASYIEEVPSLHVILVSRSDPAFPVHRFRLSDQVVEIRQVDLAFDHREARDLVDQLSKRHLSEEQVTALLERTEGWAAGLQLAGLSLRSEDDVDHFVRTFAGDDRHVADYLTEHILDLQDAEMHRFLLWSSVLDEFSAPLCNAVLGEVDGSTMIERLEREGFVMSALDDRRNWFRYHVLLRSLLRRHLRAEEPDLEPVLLQRAAEWYLDQGAIGTAIRYLVEAGDVDQAVDLTVKYAPPLFASGQAGEVVHWLEALPQKTREQHVPLVLLEAGARLSRREVVIPGRLLRSLESPALTVDEQAAADALRAIWHLERRVPAKALTSANRALKWADSSDGPVEDSDLAGLQVLLEGAYLTKVVSLLQLGRFGDAAEALRPRLEADEPFFGMMGFGLAGLIDALSGRLTVASRQAGRAMALAEECGLSKHATIAPASLALAVVARGRGDYDEAAKCLRETKEVAADSPFLGGLLDGEEAALALASGHVDEALTLVAVHRRERRPLSPVVSARYKAVEAHLNLLLGHAEQAGALLDGGRTMDTLDLASERVRLAVATHDLASARVLLDRWPSEPEPRARLQRHLWAAVVADTAGDADRALAELSSALPELERDDHIGMFLDIGRSVLGPARARYSVAPEPFLRRVIEHPVFTSRPAAKRAKGLVEQLTEQELVVLGYLPSRLSNAAIADELGVSLNTIKTHLKHIYRKFEVSDRSEAIAVAERLHLL